MKRFFRYIPLFCTLIICGCNKSSSGKANISKIMGKTLSVNRPLFIELHDNNRQYLSTGESIENYPKNLSEYKSNPNEYPIKIIDELASGTRFTIIDLTHEEKFAAGSFYYISVKILSGKHKGKVFTHVSPSDLISNSHTSSPKNWKLKPSIQEH